MENYYIDNTKKYVEETAAVLCYSLGLESPEIIARTVVKEYTEKRLKKIDMVDMIMHKIIDNINITMLTNKGDMNYFSCPDCYNNVNNARETTDLSMLWWENSFWDFCFGQDALIRSFVYLRRVITETVEVGLYDRIKCSNSDLYWNEKISKETPPKETLSPGNDLKEHYGLDYLLLNDQKKQKTIDIILSSKEKDTLIAIFSRYKEDTLLNDLQKAYKKRIVSLHKRIIQSGLPLDRLTLGIGERRKKTVNSQWLPFSLFEFDDFLSVRTVHRKGEQTEHTEQNYSSIIRSYKDGFSGKNNAKLFLEKQKDLISQIGINLMGEERGKTVAYPKLMQSDRIYLRYQIEELFGLTTVNCLYQNLSNDNCNIDLESVSGIFQLPNCFSRHYILQMALDIMQRNDIFDFRKEAFSLAIQGDSKAVMTKLRREESDKDKGAFWRRKDKWRIRFDEMIQHLSKVLFPVYFSYFFSTLWRVVEKVNSSSMASVITLEMYELLRNRINRDSEYLYYKWPGNLKRQRGKKSTNPTENTIVEPDWNIEIDTPDQRNKYSNCMMKFKERSQELQKSWDWFITLESLRSNDPFHFDHSIQEYTSYCLNSLIL